MLVEDSALEMRALGGLPGAYVYVFFSLVSVLARRCALSCRYLDF